MAMMMFTVGCREKKRLSIFYILVVFRLLNEPFFFFDLFLFICLSFHLFVKPYPLAGPFFIYTFPSSHHSIRLFRCINLVYLFCFPIFLPFKTFDQFEYSLRINPGLSILHYIYSLYMPGRGLLYRWPFLARLLTSVQDFGLKLDY